jgi:3-hydroxyisobutyrate dehydrogenase-like beta-hydroxyacid dehydrogenase
VSAARLYFERAAARLEAMAEKPEAMGDFGRAAAARLCELVVTTMLQLSCFGVVAGKTELKSDGQARGWQKR